MSSEHKARKHQRVNVPKGLTVVWQRAGQREVSRVSTIGMGGLYIVTRKPAPVGCLINLVFGMPDGGQNVRGTAVVRDCLPGKGMGVAFTGMSEEERARLTGLLQGLLEAAAPGEPGEAEAGAETVSEKKQEADSGAKKRRFPRIELPKGLVVAWTYGKQQEMSIASTLGAGGLFIATLEPPPAGSTIRMLFELPDGEVVATAAVRDSRPGRGMGVEFVEMGKKERERLDNLLKRLLR